MKSAFALTAVAGLATSLHAGGTIGSFAGGAIPDATTSHITPGVLTLTGMVAGGGTVNNLGVSIDMAHTWAGDLEMTITSPMGTTVTLVNQVGDTTPAPGGSGFGDSSGMSGNYTFRDGGADFWAAAAAAGFGTDVAPGTYAASGFNNAASALSALNGESADGMWTLTISDWGGGDTGSITGWSLLNVPTPGTAAVLGLAGLAGLRRRK